MSLAQESTGICATCERLVRFSAENEWLRDHFLCGNCASLPRERALMEAIKMFYPNYADLDIHECSPAPRGASLLLQQRCANYSTSHFYPNIAFGDNHPEHGHRCENLENMTFSDNHFDLFISQDVMEHILHPAKAFAEIARVLRPGGAHIFTVPIINKNLPSEVWASSDKNGRVVYHQPPEYHGNPIDDKGSLVTMHWGYDIAEFIQRHTGMYSTLLQIDDPAKGIRAEYIDVVISRKPRSFKTKPLAAFLIKLKLLVR